MLYGRGVLHTGTFGLADIYNLRGINIAALLLRVILGITMIAHGYNHIWGGGKIEGTAGWFESMGLKPGILHAWLASLTELGAGVMLILGLLNPLAAAGVVGVMMVAFITNHFKNGFFIFRPGEGYEYVLNLMVAALALGALGPGAWSADKYLKIHLGRRHRHRHHRGRRHRRRAAAAGHLLAPGPEDLRHRGLITSPRPADQRRAWAISPIERAMASWSSTPEGSERRPVRPRSLICSASIRRLVATDSHSDRVTESRSARSSGTSCSAWSCTAAAPWATSSRSSSTAFAVSTTNFTRSAGFTRVSLARREPRLRSSRG